MPTLQSRGQITLTDLNDAIMSGEEPINPSDGQLWVDESTNPNTLKRYSVVSGGWVTIGELLDAGTGQIIDNIIITLGNMANDNVIEFSERQVVKDRLTEIIGYIIADTATVLPTTSTLDTSGKGSFYNVRKSALNAGISSSDTGIANGTTTYGQTYDALVTKYNDLKTYLEGLTPIDAWDLRSSNKDVVISVTKSTWRDKWQAYYQAEFDLSTATSKKLKENTDNVTIGGRNWALKTVIRKSMTGNAGTNQYSDIYDFVDKDFTPLLNKEITISFDWEVTGTTSPSGTFYLHGSNPYPTIADKVTLSSSNLKGRVVQTRTITGTKFSSIRMRLDNVPTTATITISRLKIEIGNKATDWSPALEDLEGRVVDVEMKVTDNSIINTITSSQPWTDVNKDISKAQSSIDNLSVGARNYLPNTAFEYDTKGWSLDAGFNVDKSVLLNGYNSISFKGGTTNSTYPACKTDFIKLSDLGLKVGDELTLSFYFKSNADISDMPYVELCGYENTSQTSNSAIGDARLDMPKTKVAEWTRYTKTVKIPATNANGNIVYMRLLLRHRNNVPTSTDLFWYALPKVERGNVATEWSPAPDDVNYKVNNLNIGARNLIRSTDFQTIDPSTKWKVWNANAKTPARVDIMLESGEEIAFMSAGSVTGLGLGVVFGVQQSDDSERFSVIKDKEYTLSFLVGCHGNTSKTLDYTYILNDGGVNQKINITNVTVDGVAYGTCTAPFALTIYRYSITFKSLYTNPTSRLLLGSKTMGDFTGTTSWSPLYFSQIKLEEGNKATAFSPAPEDFQVQIDNKADNNIVETLTQEFTTQMSLLEDSIKTTVTETIRDGYDGIIEEHSTAIEQASGSIEFLFTETTRTDKLEEDMTTVQSYFDFRPTGLTIGKSGDTSDSLSINIDNQQISFMDKGSIVAYVNGKMMYINSLQVLTSILIGNHKVEKYNSEITIIKYSGEN